MQANLTVYSPSSGTQTFANAYLPFPLVIRFDSKGNIVVGEAVSNGCRYLDLTNQTVRRIGSFFNNYAVRSADSWIWLDVDTSGTCGPVDDIILILSISDSASASMWRLARDGSFSGVWSGAGSVTLAEGPSEWPHDEGGHYPWAVAISRTQGRMLTTGFAVLGVSSWRIRQPNDPPFDFNNQVGFDVYTMRRGFAVWDLGTCPVFPWGSRPSFRVLLGSRGTGHLGLPTFDDIATLYPTDTALAAYIHAGMGGTVPRPEITGNDLRDLIYWIRRNAIQGTWPTNPVPGPNDPDTTVPVISNVAATRLSPTSIRITWNTDKPTIGMGVAGSPSSAGTSAAYNLWSPIESSFSTAHDVTITGLPIATPTHFSVLSKDLAGNSAYAPDATI